MTMHALAMVVLCVVAVLQLILQTAWSVRNARVAREQCAELDQLSKRIESRGGLEALEILGALKAVQQKHLPRGARNADTLADLVELIREHDLLAGYLESLTELTGRVDTLERQIGITRWAPRYPGVQSSEENSPDTKPTGS